LIQNKNSSEVLRKFEYSTIVDNRQLHKLTQGLALIIMIQTLSKSKWNKVKEKKGKVVYSAAMFRFGSTHINVYKL